MKPPWEHKEQGGAFQLKAPMNYLNQTLSTSKNCWLGSKPCCAAVTGPQACPARKEDPQLRPPNPGAGAIRGDPGSDKKPCRLIPPGIRAVALSDATPMVRPWPIADPQGGSGSLRTGRRPSKPSGACAPPAATNWSLMRANPLYIKTVTGWLLPGACRSARLAPPAAMSSSKATSQAKAG